MVNVSVIVNAVTSPFDAGMARAAATARTTASAIRSAMASTTGAGGAASGVSAARSLTAATEKLTRARVAEQAALRKVQLAEMKVAEVQKVSTKSTASRLAAENAYQTAAVRHNQLLRDRANATLVASQAEQKAFRAWEVAELRQSELNARRAAGAVVAPSTIAATAKSRIDAEQAYAQAIRASSLEAQRQATVVSKANRDLQTATARRAEANAASTKSLLAQRTAENGLITAQETHAARTRALSAAEAEYAAVTGRTAAASTRTGRALDAMATARPKMDKLGMSMLKVGAVGAIGLGLLSKAAIDWEKQWIEVTKTVDFTNTKWGSSTAAMAANEKQLRGIARILPETHQGIAETAALLGTLGVRSDDLAGFTKVAIQLGTTTNLSAEEAATSLTQMMTVMGEAGSQVGHLGSALVALGLDGASTERQILNTGLRIASAGNAVGFATEDVLALGSSLASVGIQAEAGGNNMATTLTKIDRAVRGGGKSLQQYADLTSMTADEFKKAWSEDAPEALADVLDGLGQLQSEGGNLTDTLRSMGIVNIREIRNMRDLANATIAAGGQTDLFRKQLALARKEREAGTKLDETAAKTYESTAARMTIAWNNIKDSAITAGGAMLPVIANLADEMAGLAKSFGGLDPGMQGFIVKATLFGTVGLLAVGVMLKLGSAAIGLVGALSRLAVTMPALAGGLRAVLAAAGPVGIALAAVAVAGEGLDALGSKAASTTDIAHGLSEIAKGSKDLSSVYGKGPNWADHLSAAIFGTLPPMTDMATSLRVLDRSFSGSGLEKAYLGWNKFREAVIPGNQALQEASDRVDQTDRGLAKLVAGGQLEKATSAFAELATQSGVPIANLQNQFDDYREALAETAETTYGVTLSQQELVEWMGGKVPDAISKSATSLGAQVKKQQDYQIALSNTRTNLEELSKKLQLTSEEATKLATSLFAEGNLVQNTVGNHLAFAEAIDQASVAMKKNGEYTNKAKTALSDNTAKGRENIVALNNIAASGKAYVESLVLQGKGAKVVTAATKDVRDEFVKTAKAAGLNETAAKKLADSYGLVPKEVSTKITAFVDAIQAVRTAQFLAEIKGLPEEEQIRILAIYDKKGAAAALAELDKISKHKTEPKIKPKADMAVARAAGHELDEIDARKPTPEIIVKLGKNASPAVKRELAEVDRQRPKPTINVQANKGIIGVVKRELAGIPANVYSNIHITTTRLTVNKSGGGPKGGPKVGIATGGFVSGPGTPTSDSIPAWLSDGEYVIRAAAVKAIGLDRLHQLNSQGYASGGRVGFAAGGATDPATILKLIAGLVDPLGEIAKAAKALKATPNASTRKYRAAVNRFENAQERRDDLQDRVTRLSKEAAGSEKLRLARIALTKANHDLSRASKAKTEASKKYKAAADKEKEATEALKTAQEALADSARGLSDELAAPFRSASHDIDDWLEAMKAGKVDLVALNGQLAKLRKMGLSESLVQQILAQGGTVGGEVAQQILDGGSKMVASLNKANAGLEKAADELGLVGASGVQRKALGGVVSGPGTGTSDSISARLSNGEYVVNAAATAAHRPWLDAINYHRQPGATYAPPPSYAQGGYHRSPDRVVRAGDVNFNGTIYTIDPDQLLRRAREKQRDAMTMAGLRVAV